MTEQIRVGLVDDQQLVRAGLAMVIDAQDDMRVAWQADTGAEAVRLARSPTDVILMDVRMPGMDGIEATSQILAAPVDGPRVVMLTTYDLDEYLLSAIRAGASGFLLKNAPPSDLLAAIRTVHTGDAVVAPSATRRLLSHVATGTTGLPAGEDPRIASLTEREREILELIACGLSNAELSARLFLSETTIKTHVRHILTKLGVRDRVQAVVVAYETGVAQAGG
ncbi:MAG: response regulator transcription factor [Propionicimonas sp.]|uniref:response regulator transcription factor n=1 Tax=Propionicimonas sp. TaxID=1955623 RepID=UPI002B2033C6|nr:response regulator transcription factor [Propionicimonas sp.]MEA4943234.1 response regulator transcription factor [Propionicimonas sp.]MEA5118771.1 response regulator transcription factor [Propionicimonas sp.]